MLSKPIIIHVTKEDLSYIHFLKPLVSGKAPRILVDDTICLTSFDMVAKSKANGNAYVVSTSQHLLKLLCPEDTTAKLSDYAGSFIEYKGTQFLFLPPLKQLITVNYGKFIAERFLNKIFHPEYFIQEPEFKWELFHPKKQDELYRFFGDADLCAIDIETVRDDPERGIACISFTGVRINPAPDSCHFIFRTVVMPMDDEYNLSFVYRLCNTKAYKVLQNGKYDIAYLLRYGIPLYAYLLDTKNMFHAWLCELPKDLGFINAFMLRNYVYHKNEGKTGDKMEYYGYNAKDTYTTMLSMLALLKEVPQYAVENYLKEFAVVFPCILSEHTGLKHDQARAEVLKAKVEQIMQKERTTLATMVDNPNFNPNSPLQTVALFKVLGSGDITSSTPPDKEKVASRHPLNEVLINGITAYREASKLRGSYFKDQVNWLGRTFYSLNPDGTDTGRLASRESSYWCGLQIQNIPRDDESEDGITVKEVFVADEGFYYGECDYSQAEARDVAYLSGDTALIQAVDNPARDFHGHNASAFFGVPYEEIVRSTPKTVNELGEVLDYVHKTVNKVLRDLAKRTNHGANYNMGPAMLLNTMGAKRVVVAKLALELPMHWSPLRVCEYLLQRFAETYPVLKGDYYKKIIRDVETTGFLVGPTGWTRRCFGRPSKSKPDLNALVAHPSQSLNAMTLNRAYNRVFHNIWIPHYKDFKLCAQIHDSILFQYRIGREDLAWKVADCMRIPTEVKDTYGKVRTLVIPTDLKGGASRWSDVKALEKAS
jgi:DNA polymerase family A